MGMSGVRPGKVGEDTPTPFGETLVEELLQDSFLKHMTGTFLHMLQVSQSGTWRRMHTHTHTHTCAPHARRGVLLLHTSTPSLPTHTANHDCSVRKTCLCHSTLDCRRAITAHTHMRRTCAAHARRTPCQACMGSEREVRIICTVLCI